jgi:hypothetical protein
MTDLWRRALRTRDRVKARASSSARSRLALAALLARAGHDVGLVVVRTWPRRMQGEAYLWARAFVDGREDLPAPGFVVDAGRRVA